MASKTSKPKPIKRGRFTPLPGGHGSIRVDRDGTVTYRPPKKKKNPSIRKKKKQMARATRKVRAWVRAQGKKSR